MPILALIVFRSMVFAADSGIISGWVYAEGNTGVVAEAKIYLHDLSGGILDSAFTSDTGRFSAEVMPGEYLVSAGKGNFIRRFYPGQYKYSEAARINVHPGLNTSIIFHLEPVGNGMVSGQVSGVGIPDGLANVSIVAYQWRNFWEDPNLKNALTGPDGRFDLQLSAGSYFFYADCDDCYPGSGRIVIYHGNQLDPMYADPVIVVSGDSIEGIDFEFDFSNSYNLNISGRVVNRSTGQGLPNTVVTAIDYHTGQAVNSSLTASNGEFAVGNLPSGAYLIFFSGMNVIPYFYCGTENWQSAEIINLQSNYGGIESEAITQDYGNQVLAISGQVTSYSGPVSGARVYAYLVGHSRPKAFARTSASGQYAIINGLVPGSYTVVCDLFGYDAQTYPEIIQLDLLHSPEAENIDFFLEPYTTDIGSIRESPQRFEVFRNYPNPFNAQTKIPIFSSYESIQVFEMTVYDVLGRIVGGKRVSINPGMNYIDWGIDDFDGSAGSGVYFYRIGDPPKSYRMILLK